MRGFRHGAKALIVIIYVFFFLVAGHVGISAQQDGDDVSIGKYRKLFSKVLNEERTIMVHTPKGYESSKQKYPVLYQLDGEIGMLFAQSVFTLETGAENGDVPPMILVCIQNTDRTRDMFPVKPPQLDAGGGADQFLEFLRSELIPLVEKNYRAADYRILMGQSNSALFAVYAFLKRPDAFNAYFSSSPMLGWCPELITAETKALFQSRKSFNHFLFFIYGENDYKKVTDFVPDYIKLLEASAPAGLTRRCTKLEKEGHVPNSSLDEGLRSLFDGFVFPEADWEKGLKGIMEHQKKFNGKYGFETAVPLGTLRQVGAKLSGSGRTDDAVAVYRAAVELYPDEFYMHYFLGDLYEKKGEKNPAIKCFKRVLQLKPDSNAVRKRLEELEKEKTGKKTEEKK